MVVGRVGLPIGVGNKTHRRVELKARSGETGSRCCGLKLNLAVDKASPAQERSETKENPTAAEELRHHQHPRSDAKTIVLVQDNLNIHSKASLYEAFPAAEAEAVGRALRVALHTKARQLARALGPSPAR